MAIHILIKNKNRNIFLIDIKTGIKMKNKILGWFTVIILLFGSTLSSCDGLNHEHTYSSSYDYDATYHRHPTTCGHEVADNKEKHNFISQVIDPTYESGGYTNYICSVCGYSYKDNKTDALPITITWKNYDGEVLEIDKNVPYGSMPSYDGSLPIKDSDNLYDYFFSGWSPEVTTATKDTTYIAMFENEDRTYTIKFDLNGGNSDSYNGSIETKTFNKDIFFFDCIKEGWQFRGWEYNGEKIFDEKGNQLKNVKLVDNMVFKAIYSQTVKLVIVTNTPEAGTITGEGEYPYNTNVDVSVNPNQGYRFIGWYYQNTLLSNEVNYKYMMWDKDIVLEARFDLASFNLNILSNNEDYGLVLLRSNLNTNYLPEYSELIKYKKEVTIAAYSKTETRFLGWYDENNELVTTNAVYTFIMPNYDYTLEAKWDFFTISYNLNGGINNPNNVSSYSLDDKEINLFVPTKEGYDFLYWEYNGEKVSKLNTSILDDVMLEAIWSPYQYEIKEDSNGKYASIISFDDSIENVYIPKSIDIGEENVIVKEIGESAFINNEKMISITIPDSVTSIGNHAFFGCSLTSIIIPNGVTGIGDLAFCACSLTSIFIPKSVQYIGKYAFHSNENLTIYCEASSRPNGWVRYWDSDVYSICWNSSIEDIK